MMLPTSITCTGCFACKNICPKNCIEMKMDEEGFFQPSVCEDNCVHCHRCEDVCPVQSFDAAPDRNMAPTVIACQDKAAENLSMSTSGGFFGVLGTYVIEQLHGAVYGAAFQAGDASVAFERAQTKEGLGRLRGSKYVQASVQDSYMLVEKDLKEGRYVLFSGTPCQIAGLYGFLSKKTDTARGYCEDKLITLDIICHGVPSPGLFKKYIHELESRYGEKIKNFIFRPKSQEWGRESPLLRSKIILTSDIEVSIEKEDLFFFEGFNRNFYLRKSCYDCGFCSLPRTADFTIGDFWGYEELKPLPFDFKKGLSCVLLNSSKAKKLFEQIQRSLLWREESLDVVKKSNVRVCSGHTDAGKRKPFFDYYEAHKFEQWKGYIIKAWKREERVLRMKSVLKKLLGTQVYQSVKNKLEECK